VAWRGWKMGFCLLIGHTSLIMNSSGGRRKIDCLEMRKIDMWTMACTTVPQCGDEIVARLRTSPDFATYRQRTAPHQGIIARYISLRLCGPAQIDCAVNNIYYTIYRGNRNQSGLGSAARHVSRFTRGSAGETHTNSAIRFQCYVRPDDC
jgi:hypothetical protein